jgi:predicted alpha/beta-hydrolase family hydrolase
VRELRWPATRSHGEVSALLRRPDGARWLLLLAHGAGAGMRHPFLTAVANDLAGHGIATLRYQFPYLERGSRRPDPPDICHATVRAAVATAAALAPRLPLCAGGKSFGGRMTSQAQASEAVPAVRGLVFLGFPLHPPGQPSQSRAEHLDRVRIPMLFLQGTRDEFARLDLLQPVAARLADRAELRLFPDADHSFHVPARSGRSDVDTRTEVSRAIAEWMTALVTRAAG